MKKAALHELIDMWQAQATGWRDRATDLEQQLAATRQLVAAQATDHGRDREWLQTACPRCGHDVEALPPHRICDECETEVGDRDTGTVAAAERHGDEIGQRDQTAAIDDAAITLARHAKSVVHNACICGWKREASTHARHVAEQLAAVGALGDREPIAARPLLIDRDGDEWWPTIGGLYARLEGAPWARADVEGCYGPVVEKAVES